MLLLLSTLFGNGLREFNTPFSFVGAIMKKIVSLILCFSLFLCFLSFSFVRVYAYDTSNLYDLDSDNFVVTGSVTYPFQYFPSGTVSSSLTSVASTGSSSQGKEGYYAFNNSNLTYYFLCFYNTFTRDKVVIGFNSLSSSPSIPLGVSFYGSVVSGRFALNCNILHDSVNSYHSFSIYPDSDSDSLYDHSYSSSSSRLQCVTCYSRYSPSSVDDDGNSLFSSDDISIINSSWVLKGANAPFGYFDVTITEDLPFSSLNYWLICRCEQGYYLIYSSSPVNYLEKIQVDSVDKITIHFNEEDCLFTIYSTTDGVEFTSIANSYTLDSTYTFNDILSMWDDYFYDSNYELGNPAIAIVNDSIDSLSVSSRASVSSFYCVSDVGGIDYYYLYDGANSSLVGTSNPYIDQLSSYSICTEGLTWYNTSGLNNSGTFYIPSSGSMENVYNSLEVVYRYVLENGLVFYSPVNYPSDAFTSEGVLFAPVIGVKYYSSDLTSTYYSFYEIDSKTEVHSLTSSFYESVLFNMSFLADELSILNDNIIQFDESIVNRLRSFASYFGDFGICLSSIDSSVSICSSYLVDILGILDSISLSSSSVDLSYFDDFFEEFQSSFDAINSKLNTIIAELVVIESSIVDEDDEDFTDNLNYVYNYLSLGFSQLVGSTGFFSTVTSVGSDFTSCISFINTYINYMYNEIPFVFVPITFGLGLFGFYLILNRRH